MIKRSILTTCYKAFANLYGFIIMESAYDVLRTYFPNLKKNDLEKDLKSRLLKYTRDYNIVRVNNKSYAVVLENYEDKEITDLIHEQGGTPFYIPETFEELSIYVEKPNIVFMKNNTYVCEKLYDLFFLLTNDEKRANYLVSKII